MNVDLLKLRSVEFKPNLKNFSRSYGVTKIIVVGCGGTGGRIIPNIAQHISNHNNEIESNIRNTEYIKHKMELILIDMDTVEHKNLKRQNFFSFDIGKGKAEVMAERYSALFGFDIEYFNNRFDECGFKTGKNLHGGSDANYIIFDCTDNLNARKSIEDNGINRGCITIISCGNEDTFGQVLVSSESRVSYSQSATPESEIGTIISTINADLNCDFSIKPKYKTPCLPSLLNLYLNFKDTEVLSCTDMTLQNDQSMPINMLVAQIAYNVFYDIVSGKPLNYNMVKCDINNTFSTSYISSLYALRNLYITSIFGFCNESTIAFCDSYSGHFFSELVSRVSSQKILEVANGKGILKYGILKIWAAHEKKYSYENENVTIRDEIAKAKVDVIAYLEGE